MPSCVKCGEYIDNEWEFQGYCTSCWNEEVDNCEEQTSTYEEVDRVLNAEGLDKDKVKTMCKEKRSTEEKPLVIGRVSFFLDDEESLRCKVYDYIGIL